MNSQAWETWLWRCGGGAEMAWTRGRWPGQWCIWCTRGASGDREPRVSPDLQGGDLRREHCLTCPRRGSTREEAREQPSYAPERQAAGLEGVEGLSWARADLQSEVRGRSDSGGEEAGSGDRQRWVVQVRNASLKRSYVLSVSGLEAPCL